MTDGRTAGRPDGLSRREAIQTLGAAAVTTMFDWTPAAVDRAMRSARALRAVTFEPKFFTSHEWETVRVLVDLIIPKDERSGSATEALVPEFMDFMMIDRPQMQGPMRGGLAWLDAECRRRTAKDFRSSSAAERAAVLDDIAWPARANPEYSHGVAFFNSFRDLTASGFWSSKMGIEDLQYLGNKFVREWTGCPPAALAKLGVRYS
ncbi:MAG: gluconate 2-dehydrogenase subunit 3 family protein [Gemmatimonadales bacterium]